MTPRPGRRATRATVPPTAPPRATAPAATKSERIALRVSADQRVLLDEASRAEETTLSEFVLRAATRRAEDVLADRRRFVVSEADWNAFVAVLDQPARDLPRLRRLMNTPSILER